MCFTLWLLVGASCVLITGGSEPATSAEVQALRMELSAAHDELSSLKLEVVRLKEELATCAQGFQFCQQESERRAQGSDLPAAPPTTPVMWSPTSGSCALLEDGCLTTPNFPDYSDGSSCEVSIDPEWTGVLFVEYMSASALDTFYVDGEPVPADMGQHSVHGMAPRSSLVWSPRYPGGAWKVCQVNALPPWRVTEGNCHIDREGCFVTADVIYDSCYPDFCIVEFPADWAGSLNVVEAQFDDRDVEGPYYENSISILTVNGQSHVLTSSEDLLFAGVQGMVSTGFTWQHTGSLCDTVKICPMESAVLPGPWGDDPWTCTARGDSCTLPFVLNGVSFGACTQQFSDPYDADQDGSLHNGHPVCQSETGISLCGPCSCAAGEEQTYNMSSVYPHTQAVGLVTCEPCAVGRFKSLGGSGTPDSCEMCPPGASSTSGATACTNCLPGMFNDYESLECASCQSGFFSDGAGQTVCQECAAGSKSSTEKQTACDACPPGSFTDGAGQTVCQECAAGSYSSTEQQTACDACPPGFFSDGAGQTMCQEATATTTSLHASSGNQISRDDCLTGICGQGVVARHTAVGLSPVVAFLCVGWFGACGF